MKVEFICVLFLFLGMGNGLSELGPGESEFEEAQVEAVSSLLFDEGTAGATAWDEYWDAADAEKASKYESYLNWSLGNLLAKQWGNEGEAKHLVDFNSEEALMSLRFMESQQLWKVVHTKWISHTENEAARLRMAGFSIPSIPIGEQWAEELIIDVAGREDTNLKWLFFWFSVDVNEPLAGEDNYYETDWANWHDAFTNANQLGKAILLKNFSKLAYQLVVEEADRSLVESMYMSIFNGDDRQLKAIALCTYKRFWDASSVEGKIVELSKDDTDLELQALAKERMQQPNF